MRSEVFSGRKPVAVSGPEMVKSNVFAQTCNKLSQYLKEKRSLGELAFSSSLPEVNGIKEINGPTNTIMNLFPNNMEKDGTNVSNEGDNLKSLNLFPLSAINSDESTQNTTEQRELATLEEETMTKTTSMTIFYGGRVLVFDHLSENKAHEIMSLASQGTLPRQEIHIQTHLDNNSIMTDQPSHGPVFLTQVTDLLPLARRVSLHRFMEKRKNRIVANAPYPLPNTSKGNNQEKYDMMINNNIGQRLEKEIELNLFH